MKEKYKLLKCDFHLHTQYSDNREKMSVRDYCWLAVERGIDVIGMGDHHHNLTQEAWKCLQAEVEAARKEFPFLFSGYEVTFADGHMVLPGKENFDGESIRDSLEQIHNRDNVRIMAHPDNNLCKWKMNLVPGIQGIELANSGNDLYSYREDSPCNGMGTFKKYMLLRHPIAPFAQSDCHESLFFGRLWTGIWIPRDGAQDWGTLKEAILRGRTFSSCGQLEIALYSGGGAVMGDTVDQGQRLYWRVSEDSEVTVYCGDYALDRFTGSRGSFTPRGNGPYWLYVQKGTAWAVSAPIWVTGRREEAEALEGKRQRLFSNGLIGGLQQKAERLLDIVKKIREDGGFSCFDSNSYVEWMEGLLPQNLKSEEFAFKSDELLLDENCRRLTLCIDILRKLISFVLQEETFHRQVLAEEDEVLVYNFGENKKEGVIAIQLLLPQAVGDFYLTDTEEREIDFVASRLPGRREPVNEFRTPDRMREVVVWLERGEMHEFKLNHVTLQEDGDTLYVSCELFPVDMAPGAMRWTQEASRLQKHLREGSFARYHFRTRTLQHYILFADASFIAGKEKAVLWVKQGAGRRTREEKAARIYSLPGATAAKPEFIYTAQRLSEKHFNKEGRR